MAGSKRGQTVEVTASIRASRDEVWQAIADDHRRSEWWPYLHLNAVVGQEFEERWHDEEGRLIRTHGHVLDAVPKCLLRMSWQDEGWSADTEVRIMLTDVDGSTSVRIVHTGWEGLTNGEVLAEAHRQGWEMHLRNLRQHLEATT